jgi:hypothetical protein
MNFRPGSNPSRKGTAKWPRLPACIARHDEPRPCVRPPRRCGPREPSFSRRLIPRPCRTTIAWASTAIVWLPLIPDRAAVMIKKSEPFGVGDVICIWFRPEIVRPGGPQSWLKRITMNAPPWVKKFPYKDHPESDVQALIMIEQLNPPTGYRIKCADIIAIHKAVGYSPAGGTMGGTVSTGDMLPIGGKAVTS